MAITVKHTKVSLIPDAGDDTLIEPSDWNADHVLTGTVPVANGGTGAATLTGYVKGNGTSAMTAATTIPNTDITGLGTASTKDAGSANGVATLDATGKVPVSELPAAVLGALSYQGTWNASTNTPTLTSSVGTKGYYYVVSVAGTTNLNGITDWQVGDWAVYNGTAWQKVDNTDAGGDVVGPASSTDMGIARFDGTTGKLLQNSNALIDDNDNIINPRSVQFSGALPTSPAIGALWFDAATDTLNLQQNAITQQIGEEIFVYGKASAAITDSPLQIVYHTGSVGASGVVTFGPTIAGITDENAIIGVATESIPLNGFGRITSFGVVHGITTNGSAFGETWADDDVIWYNPVTGNPTKIKPVAPNIKFQIGTVINAGSGGSGSFQVNLVQGTQLGGTDSNVQLTSPTAANLLTYSTTSGYWKNTALTAGTGISVSNAASGVVTVTNSGVTSAVAGTGISVSGSTGAVTVTNTAPDQTVAITGAGGAVVTGTYPNFTITTPSGTVTSVTGTAPIASTGGATPAISISQATTSTNGYLSSTDWNTFNNKQPAGTYVTSVAATSPVTSTGGTTPTIAMPAATTSVSGYLTSTDWNTFNNKGSGTVTSVTGTAPVVSSGGATPAISMAAATGSVNGYLTSTDWTTFNSKAPAVTYTANYVPYGQGTTTPALSANFTYDPSLLTLTAPQMSASNGIVCNANTIAANFTIPTNYNAMSAGPITINTGVTVTVPTGSTWVVV